MTADDRPTVAEDASSVASAPLADLTGTTLHGRYAIIRSIGSGSMGDVYEGVQLATGQRVAVKVLKAERAIKDVFRHRFLREARSAVMIDHPSVVRVLDYGETEDGLLYFAMEFLEGEDLRAVLAAQGRLNWTNARAILLRAAGALAAAHERGIIHRDIKPSNILLVRTPSGGQQVKLIDFGVAKLDDQLVSRVLTRAADVVGTVLYMSPEQAEGQPADERSDVYTLGVTAYELCTGQVPFPGQDIFKVMAAHMSGEVRPPNALVPDLPQLANDFILRCLHKSPDARYQSMEDVYRVLEGSADPKGYSRPRPSAVAHDPARADDLPGSTPVAAPALTGLAGPTAPRFAHVPDLFASEDGTSEFDEAPTAYFQNAPATPPTTQPSAPAGRRVTVPAASSTTEPAPQPQTQAPPLASPVVAPSAAPLLVRTQVPGPAPSSSTQPTTQPTPVLDIAAASPFNQPYVGQTAERGATVRVPKVAFQDPNPAAQQGADTTAPRYSPWTPVVLSLIIGAIAVLAALLYVVVQ